MGDHPAKENRETNELTDLIFDPSLKDVSIFYFVLLIFFGFDFGEVIIC